MARSIFGNRISTHELCTGIMEQMVAIELKYHKGDEVKTEISLVEKMLKKIKERTKYNYK